MMLTGWWGVGSVLAGACEAVLCGMEEGDSPEPAETSNGSLSFLLSCKLFLVGTFLS